MYTLIRGVGGDVPIYIISAEVAVKVLASVKSPGAGLQSSAGLVQRISLCSCKRLPGGEGQSSETSRVLPREEHGYPDQALTLNHVPVSPNEPSGGGARL